MTDKIVKNKKFIPFTDDFMFSMVMKNKEICLGILNLILPDEEFTDITIAGSEKDMSPD